MTDKLLHLDLDYLYSEGYYYTEHSITIREGDREAFLDAFAAEWRRMADELLEEPDDDEG